MLSQRYWTTVCASIDEIPLSLVYGSEATVLPIENKFFKKEETFHSILKRIDEGILGHSTRKSSLEKINVEDQGLK